MTAPNVVLNRFADRPDLVLNSYSEQRAPCGCHLVHVHFRKHNQMRHQVLLDAHCSSPHHRSIHGHFVDSTMFPSLVTNR